MIDVTCVCNAHPDMPITFSKMSEPAAQGEKIYILNMRGKTGQRMVVSFTPEQAIAIRDQINALFPVAPIEYAIDAARDEADRQFAEQEAAESGEAIA